MATNQEVTNNPTANRERLLARLRERYPDREYADDEALFGQINDDYDGYDGYDNELSGYREREQKLSDMFAASPRAAAFFTAWRNGEDPFTVLLRMFGDEWTAALEDPEKVQVIAEASKAYAERIAKEEEYEKQYAENIESTKASIEQVQGEKGLTDDKMDEVMTFLVGVVRDGILGLFTPESIRMGVKALNYDSDVVLADREGEVRGRNAKIEEKLRRSTQGDGTPNLGGKSGSGTSSIRNKSFFDLVAEA